MHYEDEELKELVKGNTYTEKQIVIFLENNKDSIIVSDFYTQLSVNSERKVIIYDIAEGYIHKFVGGSHWLPNGKSKIYYIREEEP